MTFGARYLKDPQLFPARIAGESLGDDSLYLDLPAGPIEVRGITQELAECLKAQLPVCDSAGGVPVLNVFRAPQSEFHHFDLAGTELDFDLSYTQDQVRATGYECQFLIQLAPQLCMACWTCQSDSEWVAGMVHNLCRMAVAYRMLDAGGLLLHSAVISDGERAWLGYGRTGAGKTTLSLDALHQGMRVLSDDMNAVSVKDRNWTAVSSPFCGDLDASRRYDANLPLAGIYRLQKSEVDQTEPISASRAAAGLAACCPYINADPWRIELMLEVIEGLIRDLPVANFHRQKGGPILDLIHGSEHHEALYA